MRERLTGFRPVLTPDEIFIEDGRIAEPGEASERDLGGKWLMPAFVDSHSHILPTGLDLLKLDLFGKASQEEALDAIRDWHRDHPEGWLLAAQYEQNGFADGRHLTRDDLDKISNTRPILLRHANGHASVANSAALQQAGITEETPDPKGGEYERDASGRMTGVLLERAHDQVWDRTPQPTLEEMVDAILRAGERLHSFGVSSAADMMTGRWNLMRELLAYRMAAEQGCKVRLRLWPLWSTAFGPRKAEGWEDVLDPADDRVKLCGIKIFSDGAIMSATAAIHGEFTTGGSGTLIYKPERLTSMAATASDAGHPVCIHAIGDRATDHVMDALEATGEPSRHRIEHVMILSDAQIERLAKQGHNVTMQPEFLAQFGHAYRRQLPPETSRLLKRSRSVMNAGIPLAHNTDRPIVTGDPWIGVEAASNRPEGYDPAENITREKAISLWHDPACAMQGDRSPTAIGEPAAFLVCDSDPREGRPDWQWLS